MARWRMSRKLPTTWSVCIALLFTIQVEQILAGYKSEAFVANETSIESNSFDGIRTREKTSLGTIVDSPLDQDSSLDQYNHSAWILDDISKSDLQSEKFDETLNEVFTEEQTLLVTSEGIEDEETVVKIKTNIYKRPMTLDHSALIEQAKDAVTAAKIAARDVLSQAGPAPSTERIEKREKYVFEERLETATEIALVDVSNLIDKLSFIHFFNSTHSNNFTHVDGMGGKTVAVKLITFQMLFTSILLQTKRIQKTTDSWMNEIEEEAAAVESSEKKASLLINSALEFFEEFKNKYADIMVAVTNKTKIDLANNVSMAISMKNERLQSPLSKTDVASMSGVNKETPGVSTEDLPRNSENILLQQRVWESSGFERVGTISPKLALGAIRSLPLKNYRLREDTKKEVLVSHGVQFDEHRTRTHTGIIDAGLVAKYVPEHHPKSSSVDSSLLFSYNLKAITALAVLADKHIAMVNAIKTLADDGAPLVSRSNALKSKTDLQGNKKFKSMAQLASEAAALESEAATKNITLLCQRVRHSVRMKIIKSKLNTNLDIISERDESSVRVAEVENDFFSTKEFDVLQADSYLDAIVEGIKTVGEMTSMKNDTIRELIRLKEKASSEAIRARAQVLVEAEMERKGESRSLLQIRVLGEEATKEVVETIRLIFKNLADAAHHAIYTAEGNQQLLLFIAASTALAFLLTAAREIINLSFAVLQRFVMTPKLVREFGNLSGWRWKHKTKFMFHDVVLSEEVGKRLNNICLSTARGHKRGAPFRNVLLHGPSGTGKSIAAKAITSALSDIPYAIMSGGDLAPLGRLGPSELKKLLSWASSQRNGAILIIDEAESALSSRIRRKGIKEMEIDNALPSSSNENGEGGDCTSYSRDALNVMLSMTGSASSNLMLILTTCNPDALDEAVLDRMDEIIRIPLPEKRERQLILTKNFSEKFGEIQNRSIIRTFVGKIFGYSKRILPIDKGFDHAKAISRLAKNDMTKGCSGRELQKILHGVSNAVYASDRCTLEEKIWSSVSRGLCEDMKMKWNLRKDNQK